MSKKIKKKVAKKVTKKKVVKKVVKKKATKKVSKKPVKKKKVTKKVKAKKSTSKKTVKAVTPTVAPVSGGVEDGVKSPLIPLAVGDTVKIAEDSEYFIDGDDYNPKNVVGKIINAGYPGRLNFEVDWGGNRINTYGPHDLVRA